MHTGIILYDGPSKINRDPIIVIATFDSGNKKTGDMIQTWILPKLVHPVSAVNTGYDECICSNKCNLRGTIIKQKAGKDWALKNVGRSCYVIAGFAPTNVWNKYHRNKYLALNSTTKHFLDHQYVRIGSFGDPSAVPVKIWQDLLKYSKGWTSYTSNWKSGHYRYLKNICQASTNNIKDTILAQKNGWRTFRVSSTGLPEKYLNEIICPASVINNNRKKIQCINCLLCNGQKRNVVIKVHGTPSKIATFQKFVHK